MRIKAFNRFIEQENLQKHVLKSSTVVVDAQNFFYNLYQMSGLQYVFGCESDKYADYVKNYLGMFKKANVKCFFIFKGGHEDFMKRHNLLKERIYSEDFDINNIIERDEIVLPIFMKDVYKQVLDEMGFDYTICEFESKRECIALAQKLKCPIVSTDIEFCFSGLPYIMQSTLKYDELNNQIECGIFNLDDFLKNHRLTVEKLAFFFALTDERKFPEDHFIDLIKSLKIPLNNYKRNQGILQWLARNTRQDALDKVFRYTNQEDKAKFLAVESNIKEWIRRREIIGIPAMYLLNGNQVEFTKKDEFWFQKGVASKHIAIQFVNLTHTEIFELTWAITDYTDVDPRLFSADIIKYAFNLLTNFKKEHLILYKNTEEIIIPVNNSIKRPIYDGDSPFENGWEHLKGELFGYFLTETLEGFDFEKIHKMPEDLRMLMIALIYFSEKKTVNTRNEIFSIILSYIALGVVSEENSHEDFVSDHDKMIAKGVLKKYLSKVGMTEAIMLFDVKLLHPLVQFQHCLENLNFLNVLCGKLYKPTIYSKTYNGTFVYKVLHTITTKYDGDCMDFLEKELSSAPTVISFVTSLMNICDK